MIANFITDSIYLGIFHILQSKSNDGKIETKINRPTRDNCEIFDIMDYTI